jgi:hypothetical protein
VPLQVARQVQADGHRAEPLERGAGPGLHDERL